LKLIIEPDDGVTPLLSAIKGAKNRIDIVIFRADRKDIESALRAAAARGVKVTALIAYINKGGADGLRKLELRYLDAGIIVARSANNLIRYHDKFILIDRSVLYVLSFNFTHLDIDHSRGFGVATTSPAWVREASNLFRADITRSEYKPTVETFVISPTNSRKALSAFLRRAKTQLLIYDPKISDKEMLRILQERAKAGVEIRVIGKVAGGHSFDAKALTKHRLHTRTIIRDRSQAFIGSQSLRTPELDLRRELGLILKNKGVVKKLIDTFESDWISAEPTKQRPVAKESDAAHGTTTVEEKSEEQMQQKQTEKKAEIAVNTLKHELNPLAISVKRAVRKAVAKAGEDVLQDKSVKDTMKKVVKKAVKVAVKDAVEESGGD
jgi:cardiolipin synthase